jgi:hypothetical protein
MIHVMHCREIATLLDSDAVECLGWVNRLQVRIHLSLCWHCRRLVMQIAWLRANVQNRFRTAAETDPGQDFEHRLLERLRS